MKVQIARFSSFTTGLIIKIIICTLYIITWNLLDFVVCLARSFIFVIISEIFFYSWGSIFLFMWYYFFYSCNTGAAFSSIPVNYSYIKF